jgi:hypothetical protein
MTPGDADADHADRRHRGEHRGVRGQLFRRVALIDVLEAFRVSLDFLLMN